MINVKKIREKLQHMTLEWIPIYWLDTGIPDLNEVLGDRLLGIPFGRIFEISGLESQGKTALAMAIAAFAQMMGAFIIWIDFETSFTSKWAIQRGLAACPACNGRGLVDKKVKGKSDPVAKGCESCSGGGPCEVCKGSGKKGNQPCRFCDGTGEKKGSGMDESKFALIQPYVGQFYDDPKNPKKLCKPRLTCAEELCEEAEEIMAEAHKEYDRMVVVTDSIASMLTRGEAEAGLDGNLRTEQQLPKFLNRLLRRWVGLGQAYNAMFLEINQLRQNPMARFGDPWYTPGGNAPRFYSHVRARVSRVKGSKIMDKGKLVGIKGVIKNKKNKVGGVEQSQVGYKIMFAGKVEFVSAKEIKADADTGSSEEEE